MSSSGGLPNSLLIVLIALFSVSAVAEGQEDELSIYNVGPYLHIYPPVNYTDQNACVPDPATGKTCPLFIDLLMSFGGAFTSSGVVPGIQVALDQINSEPNLLPGYTLHYTLQDTQVCG